VNLLKDDMDDEDANKKRIGGMIFRLGDKVNG